VVQASLKAVLEPIFEADFKPCSYGFRPRRRAQDAIAAAHLAAWAGLAPAMNESAGKQAPAGKRHGNKWLTAMLVEAAGSVGRMHGKNYLAVQHARLLKRRGMGRAQVAVAHSMLVSAYWMLRRDEPYHDLGADWHRRRSDEAHTRRLVAQLERLGHTVTLNPAA
jgi:transposase